MKILITLFSFFTLFSNCLYAQFNAGDFEGSWRGTWFNNTFGSTDSAFLSVSIDQGASTLEAVLDLDGNVFGGSDPDPVTLTGMYDNNGFSATGTSSTYGDIFLSGDANNNMNGRMPDVPNPGIDSTTLAGMYNETNIDLAYIVYFVGGGSTADGVINLVKDPTSGVEREANVTPESFTLNQNYPNPFNPSTNIEYSIPSESFVELKVYDVLGSEVASLVNEQQRAGVYRVDFTANNLPSGIYSTRITANGFKQVIKMILLK